MIKILERNTKVFIFKLDDSGREIGIPETNRVRSFSNTSGARMRGMAVHTSHRSCDQWQGGRIQKVLERDGLQADNRMQPEQRG